MGSSDLPLVSVCVPVRNGGTTLGKALATISAQTYANLEILLSNNGSSDATAEIFDAFAAADPRARIIDRPTPLRAIEHFATLIQEARGEYIVFCADDDERNPEFVQVLVERLRRSPRAVAAFGRLIVVNGETGEQRSRDFIFENEGLPAWHRLAKSAWLQCFHVYGLWRAPVLKSISIRECTYWPDMQIMMAANCIGTFVRDDRALFLYSERVKTTAERVRLQSFKQASPLHRFSMFTSSASSVLDAGGGVTGAAVGVTFLLLRELRSIKLVLQRRLGGRRHVS